MKFKLKQDLIIANKRIRQGATIVVANPETISKIELGKQIKGIKDKQENILKLFLEELNVKEGSKIVFESVNNLYTKLEDVNKAMADIEQEFEKTIKNIEVTGETKSEKQLKSKGEKSTLTERLHKVIKTNYIQSIKGLSNDFNKFVELLEGTEKSRWIPNKQDNFYKIFVKNLKDTQEIISNLQSR